MARQVVWSENYSLSFFTRTALRNFVSDLMVWWILFVLKLIFKSKLWELHLISAFDFLHRRVTREKLQMRFCPHPLDVYFRSQINAHILVQLQYYLNQLSQTFFVNLFSYAKICRCITLIYLLFHRIYTNNFYLQKTGQPKS